MALSIYLDTGDISTTNHVGELQDEDIRAVQLFLANYLGIELTLAPWFDFRLSAQQVHDGCAMFATTRVAFEATGANLDTSGIGILLDAMHRAQRLDIGIVGYGD